MIVYEAEVRERVLARADFIHGLVVDLFSELGRGAFASHNSMAFVIFGHCNFVVYLSQIALNSTQ